MRDVLRTWAFIFSVSAIACSADSSGSKSEWSVLQGHEYRAREAVVSAPRFISSDRHILLVVPNEAGTENIWIMLNAEHSPLYKQLPDGGYRIPRSTFDAIAKQGIASPTVLKALTSHVTE